MRLISPRVVGQAWLEVWAAWGHRRCRSAENLAAHAERHSFRRLGTEVELLTADERSLAAFGCPLVEDCESDPRPLTVLAGLIAFDDLPELIVPHDSRATARSLKEGNRAQAYEQTELECAYHPSLRLRIRRTTLPATLRKNEGANV